MDVLREYHAEMGRLIMKHHGTVERFAGDAIMIFFNDPIPLENPAEHAVRLALDMHEAFEKCAIRWRKRGFDLHIGIGIAQGYATIGAIGFEGRLDYGAIGGVSNVAARLCSEAKGGQTLVQQRVLGRVEELVEAEAVGELALKGIHRPIAAYNVLRLRP
jgi:class 3 adenylate cyclase